MAAVLITESVCSVSELGAALESQLEQNGRLKRRKYEFVLMHSGFPLLLFINCRV